MQDILAIRQYRLNERSKLIQKLSENFNQPVSIISSLLEDKYYDRSYDEIYGYIAAKLRTEEAINLIIMDDA